MVAANASEALHELRIRLEEEPGDRRVAVVHDPGEELLLNEFLRTRLVELAAHTEDLRSASVRIVLRPDQR